MPVGVLAVATAPGLLCVSNGFDHSWLISMAVLLGGLLLAWPSNDFLLRLEPERKIVSAGAARGFPFVEGTKLNVFMDCQCVYERSVGGSDGGTERTDRVASVTMCERCVSVVTGIHEIPPVVHTAGTATGAIGAIGAIGFFLIDEALVGSKIR